MKTDTFLVKKDGEEMSYAEAQKGCAGCLLSLAIGIGALIGLLILWGAL